MLKSMKVKRLKSELVKFGQSWDRERQEILDAIDVVDGVVNGSVFKFDGAALIETRTQSHVNFASAPIKIGGVRFRVGQARPVSRETMTAIDTGMFTVDEDRASFVGAKHQRTWEYKKIVGYNTDADSELLIAVTNRQKMSGVRYGKGADFMVDAALNAAVERFRGNDADVIAWANQTSSELRANLESGKAHASSVSAATASELAVLLGNDEASAFVATVPGLAVPWAPPVAEPPVAGWGPPVLGGN